MARVLLLLRRSLQISQVDVAGAAPLRRLAEKSAQLVRMEVKIRLEEMRPYANSIALAGPPERLRWNVFDGIERLSVRVTR